MALYHLLKLIKYREDKIAFLLGLGIIIGVGVIVYTKLSSPNQIEPTRLSDAITTVTPAVTPPRREYFVEKGDYLWTIAQRVYGSGYNWPTIASANNLTENSPLEAGMRLIIPDASVSSTWVPTERPRR